MLKIKEARGEEEDKIEDLDSDFAMCNKILILKIFLWSEYLGGD
jgi:hypothetical protein